MKLLRSARAVMRARSVWMRLGVRVDGVGFAFGFDFG